VGAPGGGFGRLGAIGLLAIFTLLPARPALSEEGSPQIASIRFIGNRSVGARALRGSMRLRAKPWWNPFGSAPYLGPDYLSIDLYRVLDVYRDRGFALATIRDAEVRYLPGEENVEIDIHVDEGPLFHVASVVLEGVQGRLRSDARDQIRVREGRTASRKQIESSRDAIASFYGNAGYIGAQVFADLRLRGDSAEVIYRVHEGPLYHMRSVIIDTTRGALERTDPRVIRREVLLDEGDVFRTSKVIQTQERIFRTGVFRTVRVLPAPDSTGLPQADLRITAHDRSAGWYGFGAGFSSDDRVRVLGEWGNRNIGRMANGLDASAEVGFAVGGQLPGRLPLKSINTQIRYSAPWVLGVRALSSTSAYHTYERQPGFDQDITGIQQGLRWETTRILTYGVGLTNKWVRTGDPNSDRSNYVTRNITVALEMDKRDNVLNAMRGFYRQLVGDYAGGFLGGGNQFSRGTATGAWFLPIGRRASIAARTRAGIIVPVGSGVAGAGNLLKVSRIPFEERFRLGGGTSVRGYREESLGLRDTTDTPIGGTALLLGNVELRFPIVWLISGAIFFDAGNVWNDVSEITLDRFHQGLTAEEWNPLNVAYGIGGGIRFLTPVGPFRIDYGSKLGRARAPGESPSQLYFSLGQAF
jgi:outer membrane protein assembly complex protein YaeT